MDTILNPATESSPFGLLASSMLVRVIRPLTRDGQVVWVRLVACMMSLFLLVGLALWLMFDGTADAARVGDTTGWPIDPPSGVEILPSAPSGPTRTELSPLKEIVVTGANRGVRIDPHWSSPAS